jgi:hypothetical protein
MTVRATSHPAVASPSTPQNLKPEPVQTQSEISPIPEDEPLHIPAKNGKSDSHMSVDEPEPAPAPMQIMPATHRFVTVRVSKNRSVLIML